VVNLSVEAVTSKSLAATGEHALVLSMADSRLEQAMLSTERVIGLLAGHSVPLVCEVRMSPLTVSEI
jgi:hypothetical protein